MPLQLWSARVPFGRLLIQVGDPKNRWFVERASDELEPDREAVIREATRDRDGGQTENVERQRVANGVVKCHSPSSHIGIRSELPSL